MQLPPTKQSKGQTSTNFISEPEQQEQNLKKGQEQDISEENFLEEGPSVCNTIICACFHL